MNVDHVFILQYDFYSFGERTKIFPVSAQSAEAVWLELRMEFEVARTAPHPQNSFVNFRGNHLLLRNTMLGFEENFENALTIYSLEEWLKKHDVAL